MSKKYNNFLMVGTQRTGSSALAEMLNTHPHIACGWEWTERSPYSQKLQILERSLAGDFSSIDSRSREHIETSVTNETQWLGFRRLFGASNKWLVSPRLSLKSIQDRFIDHLAWLRAHPEVRILHVVRRNDIGWLKSKFVAKALESYVGKSYPEKMRVTVPLREAKARVRAKHWIDAQLASLSTTNPYLQITYEDFLESPEAQAIDCVKLLGCEPGLLNLGNTVIRKQSTRPDADYLNNYTVLVAAIDELTKELENHS